jgi:hypothetical protein
MKRQYVQVTTLLVAGLVLHSGLVYAQTQTEMEVTQTILEGSEYANANLTTQPDSYSEHGALEFWSSGGLLQEIPPTGRPTRFEAINIHPKHIRVITLVEGHAAVAHFYSEGSMTPPGAPAVSHYLTRVTQVFVNEGGEWKVRSSHWSPVTGGSGTTQTAQDRE